MDAFKKETSLIIDTFLNGGVSFPECISALDAAFAEFVSRMTREQINPLREIVLKNNERVMLEMERRGPPHGVLV